MKKYPCTSSLHDFLYNRTPTKNSKNTYFLTILAWEIFQKKHYGVQKMSRGINFKFPARAGNSKHIRCSLFLNSPVHFSDKQQPFPHRQWIIRMFDWSYYTHDKTAFQRDSFISWIAVFIGLKILGLSLAKHPQSLFVIICRISAFKKPWMRFLKGLTIVLRE